MCLLLCINDFENVNMWSSGHFLFLIGISVICFSHSVTMSHFWEVQCKLRMLKCHTIIKSISLSGLRSTLYVLVCPSTPRCLHINMELEISGGGGGVCISCIIVYAHV